MVLVTPNIRWIVWNEWENWAGTSARYGYRWAPIATQHRGEKRVSFLERTLICLRWFVMKQRAEELKISLGELSFLEDSCYRIFIWGFYRWFLFPKQTRLWRCPFLGFFMSFSLLIGASLWKHDVLIMACSECNNPFSKTRYTARISLVGTLNKVSFGPSVEVAKEKKIFFSVGGRVSQVHRNKRTEFLRCLIFRWVDCFPKNTPIFLLIEFDKKCTGESMWTCTQSFISNMLTPCLSVS